MDQIVIGTAGHIDHGKTSLVKSLTGTETDSLVEEKKRGMTIDLGFAYLNDYVTIIDVPGHEKFIRNMTAGAANIHYGLIVIAADDGIMPQTIEHIDILNILSSPNINNSSRKTFRPTIVVSTFIVPPPVSKSSSVKGPENCTVDTALDMPA